MEAMYPLSEDLMEAPTWLAWALQGSSEDPDQEPGSTEAERTYTLGFI